MGLFSKKKEVSKVVLPSLPELPSLPSEFPDLNKKFSKEEVHDLPIFPNNKTGDRFSQETIKNAISGDDDEDENFYNDLQEEVIPKPEFSNLLKSSPEKKIKPRNSPRQTEEPIREERGPVFVRIDKFEEAIKIFGETREKINEIEKLLEETRELKGNEEEELSLWEKEIQGMKQQIEKVDRDIFSKV